MDTAADLARLAAALHLERFAVPQMVEAVLARRRTDHVSEFIRDAIAYALVAGLGMTMIEAGQILGRSRAAIRFSLIRVEDARDDQAINDYIETLCERLKKPLVFVPANAVVTTFLDTAPIQAPPIKRARKGRH